MSQLVKIEESSLSSSPVAGQIVHTLDLSTPEGRRVLYSAIVSSDFNWTDLANQHVEIESVVAHYVERKNDETGEVAPALRVVGITPDGSRISGGSESVYRSLRLAAAICGRQAPWKPPLKFKVIAEKRTTGPGNWLWLDWMGETADEVQKVQ